MTPVTGHTQREQGCLGCVDTAEVHVLSLITASHSALHSLIQESTNPVMRFRDVASKTCRAYYSKNDTPSFCRTEFLEWQIVSTRAE